MNTSGTWKTYLMLVLLLSIALAVKGVTAFEGKSNTGKARSEADQQQVKAKVQDYLPRDLRKAGLKQEVKFLPLGKGKESESLRLEKALAHALKWIEINKLDPRGKKAEAITIIGSQDPEGKISGDGGRSFIPVALVISYRSEEAE